jgi:hypothetical protein
MRQFLVAPCKISPPGKLGRFVACCLAWETKTHEDARQKSPRRKLRSLLPLAAMRTPSRRQPCQRRLLPQRTRQTLNNPAVARTSRNPVGDGLVPLRVNVCSTDKLVLWVYWSPQLPLLFSKVHRPYFGGSTEFTLVRLPQPDAPNLLKSSRCTG